MLVTCVKATVVFMLVICFFYRDVPARTPNFDPPKLSESIPSLSIEFHVLLSKEEWFWDESAEVYLRFSHHLLGNFWWCYGPMTVIE